MSMDTNTPGQDSHYSLNRCIIHFLQGKKEGATVEEVVQHLIDRQSGSYTLPPPEEYKDIIECIQTDVATLSFLDKKGSKFLCQVAKEICNSGGQRRRRRRRPRKLRDDEETTRLPEPR